MYTCIMSYLSHVSEHHLHALDAAVMRKLQDRHVPIELMLMIRIHTLLTMHLANEKHVENRHSP